MAPDVIPRIAEQVLCAGQEHEAIDLLVVSNGGDPTVAWRIISVLRETFDQVGMLLDIRVVTPGLDPDRPSLVEWLDRP
jgi:hypothetical protein